MNFNFSASGRPSWLATVTPFLNWAPFVTARTFRADLLVQDGVIRQIEIIGEATKRLSRDVRKANRHVPWDDIAGMRDKLIHDYFGVDINTVWLTAVNDLPALKVEVQKILAAMQ